VPVSGVSGLAAGLCIGIVGDYGVRCRVTSTNITLFPSDKEAAELFRIFPIRSSPALDQRVADLPGSDDQIKLFVGMLIMLIFSEAMALYGI
jgi:hypothetical protein